MESAVGIHAPECPPAALEFAERWAALVKTVALFPEGSQRVRDSAARTLSALRRAAPDPANGRASLVRLHIVGDQLHVGGGRQAIRASSNLDWLRERFARALLQGVDFRATLPEGDLLDFTRQLLDHASRRQLDLSFEQLWRERYADIAPRPLHFEGRFSDEDAPEGAPAGGGAIGGSDDGQAEHALDLTRARELSSILALDASVRSRLARLRERFRPSAGEPAQTVDVVARIVRLLSSEELSSEERARAATVAALDALEERLARQEAGDASIDSELETLVFASRHRLFSRAEGPSASTLAERLRKGAGQAQPDAHPVSASARDGDEAIDGDLAAFAREYASLPVLDVPSATADMELAVEQMHAHLAALVQVEEESDGLEVYEPVAARLRSASPEELAVLRDVLRAHDDEDDRASAAGMRRLVRFLRAFDLARLARTSGYLGVDEVVARFPRHFVLFLQGLDYDVAADVSQAEDACRRIGAARIREMSARLIKQEGLLEFGLPARLVEAPARELAPLVRIAFRLGGSQIRPGVVRFLGHACQGDAAACLLYLLDDGAQLAWVYLDRLLERLESARGGRAGEPGEALRVQVSTELCRFVGETREVPEALDRRVRAVQLLGTFRTPASRKLLEELRGGRRMVFLRSEPEAVRAAAQRALDCY